LSLKAVGVMLMISWARIAVEYIDTMIIRLQFSHASYGLEDSMTFFISLTDSTFGVSSSGLTASTIKSLLDCSDTLEVIYTGIMFA
jgi:hypothetical protein